jgi:hypothetical protein
MCVLVAGVIGATAQVLLDPHKAANPLTVVMVGFRKSAGGAGAGLEWPACNETCIADVVRTSLHPLFQQTSLGRFGFAAPVVVRAAIGVDLMQPECELAGKWFRAAEAALGPGYAALPMPRLFLYPQGAGAGMCAVGGFSNVGCSPANCFSWLRGFGHGLVAHELGHLLGFSHAALDADGDGVISDAESSGDLSDPMTSDGTRRGFAAPHRLQAGWLACNSTPVGFPTAGKMALRTVSGPAPPQVLCRVRGSTLYMVTLRTPTGQDAELSAPWAGAVYLHRFNTATNTSVALGVVPPGNTVVADNVTLTVFSANATAAVISFERCVPARPVAQVVAWKPGPVNALTIKATNLDLRCPARRNVVVTTTSPHPAVSTLRLEVVVVKDNSPAEISVGITHSLTGAPLLPVKKFAADAAEGRSMTVRVVVQDPDPAAAAVVTFYDQGGDGYCCDWGPGSFTVTANGVLVQRGGAFQSNTTVVVPVRARWVFPVLAAGQTLTATASLVGAAAAAPASTSASASPPLNFETLPLVVLS